MDLFWLIFFGCVGYERLSKPNVQKDWLDWLVGLSAIAIAIYQFLLVFIFLITL